MAKYWRTSLMLKQNKKNKTKQNKTKQNKTKKKKKKKKKKKETSPNKKTKMEIQTIYINLPAGFSVCVSIKHKKQQEMLDLILYDTEFNVTIKRLNIRADVAYDLH